MLVCEYPSNMWKIQLTPEHHPIDRLSGSQSTQTETELAAHAKSEGTESCTAATNLLRGHQFNWLVRYITITVGIVSNY